VTIPSKRDLASMNVRQLHQCATDLGLKGHSKWKREGLVKAILGARRILAKAAGDRGARTGPMTNDVRGMNYADQRGSATSKPTPSQARRIRKAANRANSRP